MSFTKSLGLILQLIIIPKTKLNLIFILLLPLFSIILASFWPKLTSSLVFESVKAILTFRLPFLLAANP